MGGIDEIQAVKVYVGGGYKRQVVLKYKSWFEEE